MSGTTAPVGGGAQPSRLLEPWRYVGYRGYSKFISSDDDLFLLRRFSVLNVRVALSLQNQLVTLERQLNELDDKYESEGVHNGRFEGDEKRERLLSSIEEKLRKYNELLLQQSAIRKYKPAPKQDIKNILRRHLNHANVAIWEDELQYLYHGGIHDLICVVQKEKPPLRRVIDSSRLFRTMDLWKMKRGQGSEDAVGDVIYFSERRLDLFVSLTTTIIGLAMLVTPIWILQSTESLQVKLIVITVFIIVFLLVLSFGMVAKPFEALGATAG
ncbi:uncharacterized protein TRIVIDRAFT_164287 [Trichoderma virens Gv29-8]|uniref:DUF6594 domain-containing protein n=1 Tax=Hypocrea virens (strain Gv29-8 / FGSC 10586) TaxID=413071 RepID=G9NB55_HYPVG|nr:uncharacterized protein TRIVIDRAFT_164287 [Trichoderma virens Gv29-8]EHK16063.1 hypothetical protein TRIVIDRAFT_164287 [Trichoderma virens Gv29-8]UKZ56161.1 hypothetical protein TrVGV298_009990 [Trichoderma virens]